MPPTYGTTFTLTSNHKSVLGQLTHIYITERVLWYKQLGFIPSFEQFCFLCLHLSNFSRISNEHTDRSSDHKGLFFFWVSSSSSLLCYTSDTATPLRRLSELRSLCTHRYAWRIANTKLLRVTIEVRSRNALWNRPRSHFQKKKTVSLTSHVDWWMNTK